MALEDTGEINDLIELSMLERAFQTRKLVVARVVSYSAQPRPSVDVQIAPQVRLRPDGSEASEYVQHPLLQDVPVMRLEWGPFVVDAQLEQGDDGLLLVHDRDLDEWRQRGGEYRPGTPRIHDINDAMFLPMIRPTSKTARLRPGKRELVIGDATGQKVKISMNEASQTIDVEATTKVTLKAARIEFDALAGSPPPGPHEFLTINAAGIASHVGSNGAGAIVWTPNPAGQVKIP